MIGKKFYVYLMTNKNHSVIYTGVTSDLPIRVFQHKEKVTPGFTSHYNINKLVYYEEFADSINAISREKQIKGGPRRRKIDLINSINPNWEDLYDKL